MWRRSWPWPACLSLPSLPAALLALGACRPDLGDRESLITGPRVLAVRGEPAEARPGEVVAYDLLVVSPQGTLAEPAARWAYCAAAKPLADNNSVSAECLHEAAVRPLPGPAPAVTAALPDDACELFGPDVPPGDVRPRDADVTGGYYQPIRVRTEGQTAFGMERISCNLANAPIDAVKDHAKRYTANENPTIVRLSARAGHAALGLDAIPAGAAVTFELEWAAGDAETYPVFDRAAQALATRREALRASWFATAGQLDDDRTGRDEDDMAGETENGWTAPDEPGPVHLWVVLRDSRGGADFTAATLEVVR